MVETFQSFTKPLSELAEIYAGYSPKPEERRNSGEYLLLGGRNISGGHFNLTEKDSYVNVVEKNSFKNAIVQPGDIIVSTLFDRRKLYIYKQTDTKAVVNNSCAIIRAPQANDYIISYLRSSQGQDNFLSQASKATSGNFIPRLSLKDLARIPIPILPLSKLQLIGDEHIAASSPKELIALQNDLRNREIEIKELKEKLKSSQGKEEEIEKLRSEINQITEYFEDRERKIQSQMSVNALKNRITNGETLKLEFKSSLRWNFLAKRDDLEIELEVLRTISAFCNSEGGELLIGVNNDRNIIGIDHDHFSDHDKFLLHLRNLIASRLIPNMLPHVKYEIETVDNEILCHVICKQSSEDVWVREGKNEGDLFFYIRSGPSSSRLNGRDASHYIREHFSKQ